MYITTGFGFYTKNGKKLRKYAELPIGEHPDPIGYEVVEVSNQEELDAIILDKSDEQLAYEQAQEKKESDRKSAIAKLGRFGLNQDEINALLGK